MTFHLIKQAMELRFHYTILLIPGENTTPMHLRIEVDGVAPGQMPKNRGALFIRLTLPADCENIRITFIPLQMMNLPAVRRKKRQSVLNHVINHFLERRRVAAKGNRREKNNKIAFNEFPRYLQLVISHMTFAGTFKPA